ncbi:MAG: putative cytokinin riboside 5'-monophosphate phosphoribohydrolase [Phycisphaerae bacterium]|nr:MAG: putative cytokinin riboside 5'-monophosphate phosphoribohydrolase [Phycisphaerae bacterium]
MMLAEHRPALRSGMASIRSVAVFCGASHGGRPEYAGAAFELGTEIAKRGMTVVYGGGRAGLMGAVADAALAAGGRVVGVITTLLEGKELGHTGIQELRVVGTMHERKMMMADLADAFIALPGGLGTLDELFEILAWAQLGIHTKPVGVLNTAGYYDALMTFLDHVEREKFLRLNHRTEMVFEHVPTAMLDRLASVSPAGARFPQ